MSQGNKSYKSHIKALKTNEKRSKKKNVGPPILKLSGRPNHIKG